MKRTALFFLMSLISLCSYGQSHQDGFVKEYNDQNRKKPLSGVELLVSNANRDVSGKGGDFHLEFRTLKPGDPVKVHQIIKEGYEIFNKEQLDVWRISNNNEPFNIILCKSSKFKALKDKYNAISYKSYEEQFDKEMAVLDNLLKEGKVQQEQFEIQKKELCEYYDRKLENLDTYIDRFARIDLSEISRDEQRILDLVSKGQIQEAIDAYNALKIDEKLIRNYQEYQKADSSIVKLTKIRNDKQKQEESLLASLKNKYDLIMMQGSREAIDSVMVEYEHVVMQCPGSYRIMQGFVDFANDEYNEAMVAKWGRILIDCLPDNPILKFKYCYMVSVAEDILGNPDQTALYHDRASEYIIKALEIEPSYAITHYVTLEKNTIIKYLMEENGMPKAIKKSGTLLEMLDSLHTKYPTDDMKYAYFLGKYNIHENFVEAYLRLQNMEMVQENLDLASNYVDSLNTCFPSDDTKYLLAGFNSECGYVSLLTQDYQNAEQYLLKAKNILDEMFAIDPYKYFVNYSFDYTLLINNYFYKGDIDKSLSTIKDVIPDVENICANRPYPLYICALGDLYNNYGYISFVKGDEKTAEETYLKTIELILPYAQKNPFRHLSALCTPQINLGMLKLKQGKTEEFPAIQDSYWENTEKVFNWLGLNYLSSYVIAWDNKGYYELLCGNTDKALEAWAKIMELEPQYLLINPDSLLYQGLKERNLMRTK